MRCGNSRDTMRVMQGSGGRLKYRLFTDPFKGGDHGRIEDIKKGAAKAAPLNRMCRSGFRSER
jgi:hypothetical protein